MRNRVSSIAAGFVLILMLAGFASAGAEDLRARSRPRFELQELLSRGDADPGEAEAEFTDGVQLLYFHRTFRCPTCLEMERSIAELLEGEFKPELEDGWLEWRSIDFEDETNRAVSSAYDIHGLSLVIIRRLDGAVAEWRELDRIWDLEGTEELDEYLKREILGHLRRFWDSVPDSSSG